VVREGLSLLINRESDLTAITLPDNENNLHAAVLDSKPDLVTIDLGLQNGDGLHVIKSLCKSNPSLPTLVVSQHDEMIYAERALKAGARGYVMKEQATRTILAAIRNVLAGELYFSPRVAALALRRFGQGQPEIKTNPTHLGNLSNRELQVLELLGAGLSSRSIAEKLHLSVKTIEAHREHIKHKLGLGSSSQLPSFKQNAGLQWQSVPAPSPQIPGRLCWLTSPRSCAKLVQVRSAGKVAVLAVGRGDGKCKAVKTR
jgi:DNA-binding NarL/FixJ family response regulator